MLVGWWLVYLLPPLHVLGGSLVLNVEESLTRVGDLSVDLRIVELVAHNVMVFRVQACTVSSYKWIQYILQRGSQRLYMYVLYRRVQYYTG